MLLHPPLPDLAAFDAESCIEKKKRGPPHTHGLAHGAATPYAFPPPGAAVPALPMHAAQPASLPGTSGSNAVPAFLSSSQGRPVCPSTPMKSPSLAKLFHSQSYVSRDSSGGGGGGGGGLFGSSSQRESALSSALSMGLLNSMQGQSQHTVPMGSPTQHVHAGALSASMSARRKSRGAVSASSQHGTTPYSRPSSGSGTPRGEKRKQRSGSGDLLAALSMSRPPSSAQYGASSGASSPDRRSTPIAQQLHFGTATPMSSGGIDDTSSEESVCSSMAHSPLADPFLFTPSSMQPSSSSAASSAHHHHFLSASALSSSSRAPSAPGSLASSFNSAWSQHPARGFGPGVGLMGGLSHHGFAGTNSNSSNNAPVAANHGLSMSTGANRHGHSTYGSNSTRRASGSHHSFAMPTPSSSSSTTAAAIAAAASSSSSSNSPLHSHFATNFLNLGCIGRGSFGECYHVLQTSPVPAATGVSVIDHIRRREFAVKKSIRPFKGENDRNQKLREVDNWRRLMSKAADTQQGQHSPSSSPSPSSPPSSLDHLHLVRCYSAWEESGYLFLQSELFRSGTLRQFLLEGLRGPIDEELLWVFLLDLGRGLRFLHNEAKLIHLDLKWDNCFIATGYGGAKGDSAMSDDDADAADPESLHTGILKIGDFGLSMSVSGAAGAHGSASDGGDGGGDHDSVVVDKFADALARQRAAFSVENAASTAIGSEWNDDDDDDVQHHRGAAALANSSVTPSLSPDVAEGDQTYLAPEFMDPSLLDSSSPPVAPGGGSTAPGGSTGSAVVVGRITPAADIFSLGIMMFEAAFDVELPRRGQSWIDLRNERVDWTGRSYGYGGGGGSGSGASSSATRSPELIGLIRRMMRRDPSQRPSIEQVLSEPTLLEFAQGKRGGPQRAMLRSMPPLLQSPTPERVAELEREQAMTMAQAAAAAAEEAARAAQLQAQAHAQAQAQAVASSSKACLQPEHHRALLEADMLGLSSSSHPLRATRSRTAARAAMSAAAAVPPRTAMTTQSLEHSLQPTALEESLTPKNLFDSFQTAAADDD